MSAPMDTPSFTGTACERGDTVECACTDDSGAMGMGIRRCRFAADSPTMGALGDCERCVVPEPDDTATEPAAPSGSDADMTDTAAGAGSGAPSGAGSGAASGAVSGGGTGGTMGGGSVATSGSGATSGGGAGGTTGSSGRTGAGQPAGSCDPSTCPEPTTPFAVSSRACCTTSGRCGGRDLLGLCHPND